MTQKNAERAPSPVPALVSTDPRDEKKIGEFPNHRKAGVIQAVEQARLAARWWAGLGHRGRRSRLTTWKRLVGSRMEELAALVSAESGKPMDDARVETVLGLAHLHWATTHAGSVLRRRAVPPGMLMFNHSTTVEYHPLGVVAVIGPWNYPVFTPMGAIAYALAAGNAVVFKPSEYTPAVGSWLADTFREAVPDAPVFTVVTGDGATGAALTSSGVDKVAFTGSGATARRVMATCAESLTPVLVECGGKDALIVDRDADLAAAADAAVWGAMANAGQTCVGVERIYVADAVAERFIGLVTKQVRRLKAGGRPRADLGPITVPGQLDVIEAHIQDAVASGATCASGGTGSVHRPYVEPVVLVDVPETSRAVTEETFGPVVVINRVSSMDEAVERANALHYGLGATVFSRKHGTELARRLRCGMVGVNSVVPYVAVPSLPFGGTGESGFGRIHGADGLREFTRAQSVARKVAPAMLRPTSFTRPPWTVAVLTRLARVLYGR